MSDRITGLLHLYVGDGKGKTTAAVGLSVRARGAGKRVLIAQFLKGRPTAELKPLSELGIAVLRSKELTKFTFQMNREELAQAKQSCEELLERVAQALKGELFDLVVLDEVVDAVNADLLDSRRLLEVVSSRGTDVEMVMTGRNPKDDISDAADYITVMTAVKHPYERGIASRLGIEF
jgi:cob(I)alamin adenosyltransferase